MNWLTVRINDCDVQIAFDEHSIHIYNAFPIKDNLKSRGYRWNPLDKSWFFRPADLDDEIRLLKNNMKPDQAGEEKPSVKAGNGLPVSYSIQELRNYLEAVLTEKISQAVWVRGVVASEVKKYDWASFFDFRDEEETANLFIRAEVRKPVLTLINQQLREKQIAEGISRDLPLFCLVEIHLSNRYSTEIRLLVKEILPEYTQAKLRNQREITLERLKSEGLLEKQKLLRLPMLIQRIGLITSGQGTSVQDIMAGLHPWESQFFFYFVDSRMEGAHAVQNIIQSIDQLEKHGDLGLDAIIIARGGGSEQSLAVFNDYQICRRVCLSAVPIIAAIGHEKDVSAIELCSCFTPTPSTPSGLGKFLKERTEGLRNNLGGKISEFVHLFSLRQQTEREKIHSRLSHLPVFARKFFQRQRERLASLVREFERLSFFLIKSEKNFLGNMFHSALEAVGHKNARCRREIEQGFQAVLRQANQSDKRSERMLAKSLSRLDLKKQLGDNFQREKVLARSSGELLGQFQDLLRESEAELSVLVELVRAHDPENILRKGFTLVTTPEDKIIKSVSDFQLQERAWLRFHDGRAGIRKEDADERQDEKV